MKEKDYTARRYDFLDYARGIGIFFVVYGHVIVDLKERLPLENQMVEIIYACHMALFLIISGMTMYRPEGMSRELELGRELKKNGRRLLLPYLVWSGIYILYDLIRRLFAGQAWRKMEKSLVKKVIYTLSGRGLAPLWFLLALFFARSVIQILDSIRRRRRYRHQEHRGRYHEQPGHHHEQAETGQRVWLCGLGLLACFLSIFCRWMTEWIFQPAGKMPLLGITLMRILPCMVFLIVGMLLRMSLAQVKKRKIWILLASLFVFFAVILSCKMDVNLHLMRFSSLPLAYVTGITGSLGILMFCLLLPQEGKAQKVFLPLQCLGRASLNIMALHYMDLPIYQILHSLMPEKAGGWGHLVFTLVLLGVCYGLHRILKKEH